MYNGINGFISKLSKLIMVKQKTGLHTLIYHVTIQ
jgi:hypothetical protein